MTFDVTQRFQAEQGWTDSTLLGLLLEYLSNQQSDDALEDFLQQKAAFENEASGEMLGFTPQGVPRLTLEAKLGGFTHCVQEGHWEDALGHLFDLMHYLCPKMAVQVTESGDGVDVNYDVAAPYGSPTYFSLLHNAYGRNPTQLRGPDVEEEAQPAQSDSEAED
jgi:hypothetical protein